MLHHSPASLKDDVINFFLLLSELAVNREGGGDVRAVVVDSVGLINKHCLTSSNSFVVVIVMESSSSRSAPNNGCVGVDSPAEVVLLTVSIEDALQLVLSHTVFDGSHDLNVSLTGDTCCPFHDIDLFFVLYGSALTDDIVHHFLICGVRLPIFLLRNLGGVSRVRVDAKVNVNLVGGILSQPGFHLLNVVGL